MVWHGVHRHLLVCQTTWAETLVVNQGTQVTLDSVARIFPGRKQVSSHRLVRNIDPRPDPLAGSGPGICGVPYTIQTTALSYDARSLVWKRRGITKYHSVNVGRRSASIFLRGRYLVHYYAGLGS